MSHTKHNHIILYAEDDMDDLYMVTQAFNKFDETIKLVHAPNGFETIRLLEELKSDGTLPCLLILDINMPVMNGKEALALIKQSNDFKHIPAILFTTSSAEGERIFAEKWGADFITKPLMFEELEQLARTFVDHCQTEVTKRA